MTAGVPAPSKVVIETVLAAWAVAAFVSPATGHEMVVEDVPANAVVKVITRIALLHATVAAPATVAPFKVHVAELVTSDVTKLVPATVIVLMAADVAGVKSTAAVTPVAATTLLDNVKTAANMAGTATPAMVSTGANPALIPKVDMVEVVAAAAALGVVRPETTHTTAAFKATGVARTSFTLGEEYVAVIVPGMAAPALVHVAVGLLPVKEVKPVTVITCTAVADAPVNPTVMVEAVEMTLLENATEADVKTPANITPELTPEDAPSSTLVVMTMPFEFSPVAAPIVKPVTVNVTAAPEANRLL